VNTDDIPNILVEKLALGELSDDEAKRVTAALGDDAPARLAALASDDEAVLARLPAANVATEVARRVRREQTTPAPRASALGWWIPAGALAAAAAVAWLWVRPTSDPVRDGDDLVAMADGGAQPPESIYLKGDARIWIERVVDGRGDPLADGATVADGETLQVHYHAADQVQGVIVSIDGNAAATLHFPSRIDDAPTLKTGGPATLDHAYELDDAPRFERFFFVTAPAGRPLDVAEVLDAAHTLAASEQAASAPLSLPEGLEQKTLLLHKR
jgi:hypothetical protein